MKWTRLLLLVLLAACADNRSEMSPVPAMPAPGSTPLSDQMEMMEYQSILFELRRVATCVTETEAKPEFAPLRARTPKDEEPFKLAHLQDKHKANEKDKGAIDAFLKAMTSCEPQFLDYALRAHRNIARMISDTWRHQQSLYLKLRNGNLTWGEFNQETKVNSDKLSGGLEALRLTHEN